jgi:hypothetical protein
LVAPTSSISIPQGSIGGTVFFGDVTWTQWAWAEVESAAYQLRFTFTQSLNSGTGLIQPGMLTAVVLDANGNVVVDPITGKPDIVGPLRASTDDAFPVVSGTVDPIANITPLSYTFTLLPPTTGVGNTSGSYNVTASDQSINTAGDGNDTVNVSGGTDALIEVGNGNDMPTFSGGTGNNISIGNGGDTT